MIGIKLQPADALAKLPRNNRRLPEICFPLCGAVFALSCRGDFRDSHFQENQTMTQVLTTDNFEQEVLDAPVPVLVDFWSPLCGPCRRIAPLIDELAAEANGKYRIGKVDAYDQPDLATQYRISALPTLMFFKGGKVVHSLVGCHDKHTLFKALQQIA
jgi:thioredoxin 1